MGIERFLKGVLLASRLPNLLVIALAQILSAYMLSANQLHDFIDFRLVLLVVSTMMVAAGGYIINDYYDQKIDMVNRPEKVVIGFILSRRKAIAAHLFISVLAISLGFIVSWKIGLLHIFSVCLLWFYSNLLRRYFIGKITIAVLACLSILAVGLMMEVVSYRLMAFSAFGASIIWIRELIKDLENAPGGRAFGVESMPEVWGISGTKHFILLIGLVSIVLLIYFLIEVESRWFTYYYMGMAGPVIIFSVLLFRADRKLHFTRLRRFTNFLILAGLLSMLIV